MAKINLGLDVLQKRPDGYHNICSVMQAISLWDVLDLEKKTEPGISLLSDNPLAPADETNLAWRAASLLLSEFSISQGVVIRLQKKIPVAAGLAGGSTDGAATLLGMNRLFGLGLSLPELMKRGAHLGADVPFCILGGTALAEGIGEALTPLPALPPCRILLAKPPIQVSTKQAYGSLSLSAMHHPDMEGIVDAIHRRDLEGMAKKLGNVFEEPIQASHPQIGRLCRLMCDYGALAACMSGSGPTVFGIFSPGQDKELAKAQAALARELPEGFTAEVEPTRNMCPTGLSQIGTVVDRGETINDE